MAQLPLECKRAAKRIAPSETRKSQIIHRVTNYELSGRRWAHRATTRLNLRTQTPWGEKGQSAGLWRRAQEEETTTESKRVPQEPSESAAEGVPPGHLRQVGSQGRQHKMSKETPAAAEQREFLTKRIKGRVKGTQEPSWKNTRGPNRGATANKPWKDAQHR